MTSLQDFAILCKLGTGSYSEVYRVRRLSDNKEYALKKVNLGKLNEKERENSLNEVRILASVQNPYVIAYKEAFYEAGGFLCIVMEYADGGDL
jgi:NIMA (never in mitosis gene a)-related kinase